MKTVWITLAALFGAGCVTGYNPSYTYNQLQVVNLSGDTITDVRLRVPATGRSVECAEVKRNAICNDYFGKRRYPKQVLDMSWTDASGNPHSEQATPAVPVTFSSAFPLRVVVEIMPDGSIKAFFEQDEPSRDGDSLFISGML